MTRRIDARTSLSCDQMEELDELARIKKLSRSDLLRRIVVRFLERSDILDGWLREPIKKPR